MGDNTSIINHIWGEKVIPVSCYYGTPAFTYYHHISEKPNDIYGKNDTVIIYEPLPDANIADKEEKKIIGYHSTLLKAYIKNNDGCTIGDGYAIKRIDVYLDNEILKSCTILDTPGLDGDEISATQEVLTETLNRDYILLTTSFQDILEPTEIYLIKKIIKLKRNGYFILPNLVVTHLDLCNDAEGLIKACKKNLLGFVAENEKNFIEENYKNGFLAVNAYSKENSKIFNNAFSATVNELLKNKYRILIKNIETVCVSTSKDYSARKNILNSKLSSNTLDETNFQNMVEELFLKKGKIMCDTCKTKTLANYSDKIYKITSMKNVLCVIKEKK